jgi:hypothetical protein
MPASHFDVNSMTGRPKFIVRHSTFVRVQLYSVFHKNSLAASHDKSEVCLSTMAAKKFWPSLS